MNTRFLKSLAPALLVLACFPLQAAISTELTLADNHGDSVSINQNGAVVAHSGAETVIAASGTGAHGSIIFVGTVGNFSFNVTVGRGGSAELLPALIDLNSIDVLSHGVGMLTLTFGDTAYNDLDPLLNLSSSVTFTSDTPKGSSASFTGYGSAADAIPATTLIGSTGTFVQPNSSSGNSFSGTQDFANPIGSSGSLSEQLVLAFTGGGEIDSGFTIANVAPIPEPASVVFLGSSLLGLAAFFRKKLSKRE